MSDQIYIAIVEEPARAETFAQSVYQNAGRTEVSHFLQLNGLQSDTLLTAGRVVVVPSAHARSCTAAEQELAASLRALQAATPRGQALVEQPRETNALFEFLEFTASQTPGGLGAYSFAVSHQIKTVQDILAELQRLYQTTYTSTGKLNSSQFHLQRAQLLKKLDHALKGWVRSGLIGASELDLRRGLNLSTRRTLHAWNQAHSADAGIPKLKHRIEKLNGMGRTAARVGYVGIVLDVAWSVREIKTHVEANAPDRDRKISGEGGRLVGSVGGGMIGGAAASYVVCNLVLGLPTAGTSLLWCGIVAGGAGAFAGGYYGAEAGKELGVSLYDSRSQ